MDFERRKELVMRNTEEVVTEEEIDDILETKDSPNTYVGFETSGPVHLGHWISVRKLLDLQEAGFHVKVLWPDLHTYLNRKGDEEWIEDMIDYWQAVFEALGLDAEYVLGTSFEETKEYQRDVLRLSLETTIKRGKRSMQEVARDYEHATVSQIIYPLMQALDIEYLDLDLAVGGIEQRKIHMLAREALPKIGYRKPTCLHHPLMTSLTGGDKMSSSKPKTMFPLHADSETIQDRINQAYCPEGELEDNSLIEICKYHVYGADKTLKVERPEKYGGDVEYGSYEELVDAYTSGDLHPADLKSAVADFVVEQLEPVRERFRKEPELLDPLEEIGHEKPSYIE
ncbi:MAG: tyrosine--tRNA ligase [Candidatus Nanohaloarchaeota archaeon QJJ-9]|nr:tyrosine--tRNA ligase [Candidatus Nanohaloarchaeota archaeon QJJ-9]